MKGRERWICRNQLSVILIGWGRCRKKRHCRSKCYGVLLLGWVLDYLYLPSFIFIIINISVDLLFGYYFIEYKLYTVISEVL